MKFVLYMTFVTILTLNDTDHGMNYVLAFVRSLTTERIAFCSKTNSVSIAKCQRCSASRSRIFATNAVSFTASSEYENRMVARQYIQEGMQLFRNGDVSKSIEYFNAAEQNDKSIAPFLWQRGLSYYYNQQYDKASQQFRIDVSVNPSDVEEIVWDIASQLQYHQMLDPTAKVIFPIPNQLSLPPGSKDRRRIMGYVYQLFRGEGTEHDLALAGSSKDASLSDEFYALFYLALYNEVFHRPDMAALYLNQALGTKYGQQSNDYMVACAKVQSRLRK